MINNFQFINLNTNQIASDCKFFTYCALLCKAELVAAARLSRPGCTWLSSKAECDPKPCAATSGKFHSFITSPRRYFTPLLSDMKGIEFHEVCRRVIVHFFHSSFQRLDLSFTNFASLWLIVLLCCMHIKLIT